MKTYVITLSKVFLKDHPRAGEETRFKDKFESEDKKHTIRENIEYWSNVVDKVNNGEAVLSVRQWSGKPYRSSQEEIGRLTKLDKQLFKLDQYGAMWVSDFGGVFNGGLHIDGSIPRNDGLSVKDFNDWFNLKKLKKTKQEFNGIIIHFTDLKY